MKPEVETIIVRAYVNYARTTNFDQAKFSAFIGDHPEVLGDVSRDRLKKAIHEYGEAFVEDVDPQLDLYQVRELVDATPEVNAFFESVPDAKMSSVAAHLRGFPFKQASAKKQLRTALLTLYGADELGDPAAIEQSLDNDLASITGDQPDLGADPMGADPMGADPMGANTTEDPEMGMGESLPPDIEDEAVHTIEKYLMQDVFNNKIIPKVTVLSAWKVQNGYVIRLAFASNDDKKKIYTHAVIHNDRLVLPAEITSDPDGKQVIGDFDKETILQQFAESEGTEMKTENYSDLMDQMVSSPTPVAASKLLDKIVRKFGQEVGNEAFRTYTMLKKPVESPEVKVASGNRLDVKTEMAELSSSDETSRFFGKDAEELDKITLNLKKRAVVISDEDIEEATKADHKARYTASPTEAPKPEPPKMYSEEDENV